MPNKAAEKHLYDKGWIRAGEVVADLIEAGFIEDDPLTEPERIAEAAKNWLGRNMGITSKQAFDCASGWTSDSWEYVLGEQFAEDNPMKSKEIFKALVILAKEAGIEL